MLVYIPKRCCTETRGYLLGCVDVAHSFCCVTGLIPFSEDKCRSFAPTNPLPHCTCGIIGTWTNDSDVALPVRSAVNHTCSAEHLLLVWRRADKVFVAWNSNRIHQQRSDGTDEFVIILYDSLHFSSSVVAVENGLTELADERVLLNEHAVLRAFICHKQFCNALGATKREAIIDFTCRQTNVITQISSLAYQFAVYFASLILAFCSTVCNFRLDIGCILHTHCGKA